MGKKILTWRLSSQSLLRLNFSFSLVLLCVLGVFFCKWNWIVKSNLGVEKYPCYMQFIARSNHLLIYTNKDKKKIVWREKNCFKTYATIRNNTACSPVNFYFCYCASEYSCPSRGYILLALKNHAEFGLCSVFLSVHYHTHI